METRITTDVLIIGGGVAGLNAALTAAEAGAQVVVTDKAVIERSGNIAGGVDHFLAYLNTGPEWDTKEAYLRCTWEVSQGAADLEVVDAVYCSELDNAFKRFAQVGVDLERPDGSYYRTQSYGHPGPWWINFNGKRLKPKLGAAVRKAGCKVLDRVTVTDLLVAENNQVAGALGFHIRTGEFYEIRAKTVVVASGGINRLYVSPSGLAFNTWLCPVNTGDGQAVAYRAGATLANMEILRMTLGPQGLSAAGLNAFMGMGGRLVNSSHQEFMTRYDARGNRAPRYKLVSSVLSEMHEGRAPIYLDCRHLEEEDLKHLIKTLGYDKDTLPDFFKQKGIDLKNELLEISVSEGMQGGPSELTGSGVKIDANCESTLAGLFAAGNCSDQCRSLHMAFGSGIRAGRFAAQEALKQTAFLDLNQDEISTLKHKRFRPMTTEGAISWEEFEDVIKRVMTQGVGPIRSESGLEHARSSLEKLKAYIADLRAENYHQLCRITEACNMLEMGGVMIQAALFRKESRFGIGHFRSDFPERDDQNWLGQVLVKKGGPEPECSFLRLSCNL